MQLTAGRRGVRRALGAGRAAGGGASTADAVAVVGAGGNGAIMVDAVASAVVTTDTGVALTGVIVASPVGRTAILSASTPIARRTLVAAPMANARARALVGTREEVTPSNAVSWSVIGPRGGGTGA